MKATPLTLDAALAQLHELADPQVKAGLAHFGSRPGHSLGIRMPDLRQLARGQRSHPLALGLWASGIHEARILASLVDDPRQVTREQMEAWVQDFDAWDLCDQVCGNLFDRTPYAVQQALDWAGREEEYVRRAGFVLMAGMAVHRKDLPDEVFLDFLPVILAYAGDERNFVRKAVNWALRSIGKNRTGLWAPAVELARQMEQLDSPAARWNAKDALRELLARPPRQAPA
ncbi:MAG: DNA alkylation repair protein [Anaerolineaceae bacterium]|nr:DNA alkylation repair protein [Anaerolineaceae bacterium]